MNPNWVIVCLLIVLSPIDVTSEINESNYLYYGRNKIGELILNDLVSDIQNPSQEIGFVKFFHEMAKSDLYSTIGTMLSYVIETKYHYELEYIKNYLPPELNQIPWVDTISIYNAASMRYLCSGNKNLYVSTDLREECFWDFKVESNGRYFKIVNPKLQKFIAPKNDVRASTREVHVFDSNVNDNYLNKWQLEVHRGNANDIFKYRIKNFRLGDYLTITGYSGLTIEDLAFCNLTAACQWELISSFDIDHQIEVAKTQVKYMGRDTIAQKLLQYASDSSTNILEYRKLFGLMMRHDGFYSFAGMMLDYVVQQLQIQYPNDVYLIYMNDYFRSLWEPFPWDQPVTIKNNATGLNLCPTNVTYYNMPKTYIADIRNETEDCFWMFNIDPTEFYFKIKLFSHDQYLIAASNEHNYDHNSRRVLISKKIDYNLDIDQWQCKHERVSTHHIVIKNTFWDEILYDRSSNESATWREFGCAGTSCVWEVRSVNSAVD